MRREARRGRRLKNGPKREEVECTRMKGGGPRIPPPLPEKRISPLPGHSPCQVLYVEYHHLDGEGRWWCGGAGQENSQRSHVETACWCSEMGREGCGTGMPWKAVSLEHRTRTELSRVSPSSAALSKGHRQKEPANQKQPASRCREPWQGWSEVVPQGTLDLVHYLSKETQQFKFIYLFCCNPLKQRHRCHAKQVQTLQSTQKEKNQVETRPIIKVW